MPATDGELISRIALKDYAAFDELFLKYKESIYRFAFYLTQNSNEADDLFQETWLRAVRHLFSSSEIRDFKAWMLTVTANLHRDQLRKRKIRHFFSLQLTNGSRSGDNDGNKKVSLINPKVNDDSKRVDISLDINKAIATLPLKQRRVFVLKEIEGLKHSEISEILNVPVGTIKSLLHRAVKKLQQELSDFRMS